MFVIMEPVHNLDINTYSLDDLLNLFELDYNLSTNDMLQAKRKVLMMHPDKSNLPSKYFIFYKKAYEIVLDLHRSKNKITEGAINPMQPKYTTDIQYNNLGSNNSGITQTNETDLRSKVGKMVQTGDFSKVFNSVYEENMAKKINKDRNTWFQQETPDMYSGKNITTSNMAAAIEEAKRKQQAVSVYRGVKPLKYSGGNSIYDEDEDELDTQGNYIECDVFSKFKFEDIRKVHRDQTVMAVSESDYDKVEKYASVEQYNQARSRNMGNVASKAESEAILQQQMEHERILMMRKQQRDLILQRSYEEKQQNALSSFLRLGN